MDRDAEAMKRRDDATAKGCRICVDCEGTGKEQHAIWSHIGTDGRCGTCKGETWLDAQGRPFKIDG